MSQPQPSGPGTGPGLSSEEARRLLETIGPNAVLLEKPSPVLLFLSKFWQPVPWMLEAAIVIEFALGKFLEATIIVFLLLLNGIVAFQKEQKGQKALDLLQSHLAIQARVKRDGAWKMIPSQNLVPGDSVHLRMGDFVPADLALRDGTPLLDQSSLTGEALPIEKHPGDTLWAGSVVRRGEGTGTVTETGIRCAYGKTVQLVHDAKSRSHFEEKVLQIVRSLLMLDILLALFLFPLALHAGMSLSSLIPFLLILLISAIPVALPPTFTLANALSAAFLSTRGILVTRLSSISDAAAMEELLSDKTGTLTENSLSVKELRPRAGISEEELLEAALAASDASTQDPLDMALYAEGKRRKIFPPPEEQRLSFVPFDPSTKRTEALVQEENGLPVRIIKGSPIIMASLGVPESDLQSVKGSGQRTIAVAKGPLGGDLRLLGLVSFSDPLRGDSLSTIQALKDLGIRVRLVTGDTAEAAASVARELGLDGSSCSGTIRADIPEDCQILAGVLPEDKFHLVRILQKKGEIVGMTGDGVNDAPALRQAEVGIAVSTATDIARASAGIILVDPGLSGLIEAVREGRRVYHRMQNYILNKVVKTLEVAFFLTGGLLLFHSYVVSSRMVLLLIFTNDFVTMALASDNVRFSGRPDRWNVRTLAMTAVIISVFWLSLTLSIFYAGRAWLHLSLPSCQTLGFLTLVLTGLGNVLVIRERGSLWKSRPGKFLALALAADILITGILSGTPLLLPPLPLKIILSVLAAVALATLAIDRIKGGLLEKWEEES